MVTQTHLKTICLVNVLPLSRYYIIIQFILGNKWYDTFLKTHQLLRNRKPEAVKAASSENDIRQWFSNFEDYLKSKDCFTILSDPTRVINGADTCFQFFTKFGKVLAAKDSKNL